MSTILLRVLANEGRLELSSGLVFLLTREQGCMATVRSAMCCLVWSRILQQVFYGARKRRRFCRDAGHDGCSEKTFSSVYFCAKCVCVCVCLWCSHRGASQQIISPLWQGFPAEEKHATFYAPAGGRGFEPDKRGLSVLE